MRLLTLDESIDVAELALYLTKEGLTVFFGQLLACNLLLEVVQCRLTHVVTLLQFGGEDSLLGALGVLLKLLLESFFTLIALCNDSLAFLALLLSFIVFFVVYLTLCFVGVRVLVVDAEVVSDA